MGAILKGNPTPLRYCPPNLLAKKNSPFSWSAGVLAVKPERGGWEGFTSWDRTLVLPPILDGKGNYIPPMPYEPCGLDMTTVPTQLKLSSQSADVKALAPRTDEEFQGWGVGQIPSLYLDRDKLLKGYYVGAFWAYGELDPKGDLGEILWWTCGEIGNVQLDDLAATIELATYDELANRKIGAVYHIICQVGAERNEEFGTGRCRNQTMNDGPLRDNWTVAGTVLAGSSKQQVNLSIGSTAITGAALHPQFVLHLANGDLEFPDNPLGGLNSLLKTPLRDGNSSGGIVSVYPKISLPYFPTPGDMVNLVAGCRRTKNDCVFFGNLPNMRAQDLQGNDDLLRRTKVV